MIWVISGSRDSAPLESAIDMYVPLFINSRDIVYHGGAVGVDTRVGVIAEEIGAEVIVLKPNWVKFGKAAGVIRNEEMLTQAQEHAAELQQSLKGLVFWDGESRGTKHMLKLIELRNIDKVLFTSKGGGPKKS